MKLGKRREGVRVDGKVFWVNVLKIILALYLFNFRRNSCLGMVLLLWYGSMKLRQ